jgi:hypothetical protein
VSFRLIKILWLLPPPPRRKRERERELAEGQNRQAGVCVFQKMGSWRKKKYFLNRTEKVGRSSFKAITHTHLFTEFHFRKRERKNYKK